jgi:aminopeptidase N
MAMAMDPADPAAIHGARSSLRKTMAVALSDRLERIHDGLAHQGAFSADSSAAGRRALRNAALDLLTSTPSIDVSRRALDHFEAADNMTDAIGGLTALINLGGEAADSALSSFHARWRHEPLVIDKWFQVLARDPSDLAHGRVIGLTTHADFEPRNPNRLRALIGAFASFNPARFHEPDGSGYRFLADWIISTDAINPMTAARLVEPLGAWRRFAPPLGARMQEQLQRIAAVEGLSSNVFELATKALA